MSASTLPLPTPPHNLFPQKPTFSSLYNPPSSPKTPTIRTRLSQLCKDGHPQIARQLFDTLPRPSTVLWNTIIIGFICNNMPFEALLFYSKMRSNLSTKCDSYTYSSVLKACADTRELRVGKAVHCQVLRSQINASRIVYNSLLNMYSSCLDGDLVSGFGEIDLVCRVFGAMKKRNVVAWNTLISWYVKIEKYVEAVKQFRLMMKMGIRPTAVSFVNLFPGVSSFCDYRVANVLYGMLVKFGSKYVGDPFVVSSAILMYSEMGDVDVARKVFEGCLEKNVEVWNTMIGAYIQNRCYVEALDLFVEALGTEQVLVDDLTFLTALTAASQLQQRCIGQQLHAYIIKNSMLLSIPVVNAVIVLYSRCGLIDVSFKVFDMMQERDTVTWNSMITALVQNGFDEEGLLLVFEMQKQGFTVDSVTTTALLSAASNLKSDRIGKETHAYLIRQEIRFEGMESYLVDMYAKSGLIGKGKLLFERNNDVSRDQATWNAMISANAQNGLVEETFTVFCQMLDSKALPNAVTIASVLPACSQMGSISPGRQIHGFAIRHFLDHNVYVSSALVDMYSKLGAITSAENVFFQTPVKSIVTYTNMILGYGQHGMGDVALILFKEMLNSGVKPDAITFIAILSACSYAGLVDEGLQIFDSMEEKYKIRPSLEHFCCVVDMLSRDGRLEEACTLADELGEGGHAIRAWGSVFAACKIHRQYELAKIVADKLLEMESRNSMSGYHVLLSHIHADEGNWKNADRIRKEMQDRGLRKEVGCSWIEIAGQVDFFASRDWKHQKSQQIYDTLTTLAANMKDAGYRRHHDSLRDQIYDSGGQA